MNQSLRCQCGTLQGSVGYPEGANRVVCYCRDCQAFAHFLGRESDVLDERGGSDVIQVLPKHLTFSQGRDALACVRLTDKGLLRWYASCCKTPIGNTLATPKLSFVGLVHSCLEDPNAFGPVRAVVFAKRAKGDPKPADRGQGAVLRWFLGTTLKAFLTGDFRRTPLFREDGKTPVATPRVLTAAEHASLMQAVDQSRSAS